MASTVLPNGIIIPEKFSRDWYADLYHNWEELDNLLGGGTPKDGTLTIQKNGTDIGTFSANQATDETINITVPDVNDGTLTIQQNGTTVDTFTANSSSDKTVNIEVPDVNNGTLTIQQNGTTVDTFTANSSSDKTVNIQCVDLTNNQTVGGNKEFTGTTTAHDVVPSATDTYNFGSSNYQWNNAYIKSLTINGVAAGDILTHNASEFVDVTTAQSVGGQKIFSHTATGLGRDLIHFASVPYGKNTPPANTSYQYIWFQGNTASQGFAGSWYGGYLEQRIYTDGSARGRWFIRDTSESGLGIELFVKGSDKQFRPQENNTTDFGTSTYKWKSFNGINPGALSLPGDTYITIDTTDFVWGRNFTFTPSVNGYLFINLGTSDGIRTLSLKTGRGEYHITNQKGILRQTIPVYQGKIVAIVASSSITETESLSLTLFPLQGNV